MKQKRNSENDYILMNYNRIADMHHYASTLMEVSSDVTKVVVEYHSKSGSFEGTEVDSRLEVSSDSKFLFLIHCPNGSCTDIGFDLGGEVREVIRNKKTSGSGKKICAGWEDSERVGRHKCLSEIEFTITVEYR